MAFSIIHVVPTRRRRPADLHERSDASKMKIGTGWRWRLPLLLLISALAAGGISGAKRLTERSAALYGDRTVPMACWPRSAT